MKLQPVRATLFPFVLVTAMALLAAAPETPWDALRHLSKRHVYAVLNRDGSCAAGAFVSVSENAFVIEQAGERSLPKAEILRISTGEKPDVHTTVYSARSSWADVQALQSPPYYSNLLLVTADGRQFNGFLIGVWSDQLSLMVNGKEMRFAKEFLARILLTGKKPAFEGSQMFWNPMKLPRKMIPPMQPVPLYEVTAQQDNSTVECSVGSRPTASLK